MVTAYQMNCKLSFKRRLIDLIFYTINNINNNEYKGWVVVDFPTSDSQLKLFEEKINGKKLTPKKIKTILNINEVEKSKIITEIELDYENTQFDGIIHYSLKNSEDISTTYNTIINDEIVLN